MYIHTYNNYVFVKNNNGDSKIGGEMIAYVVAYVTHSDI